MKYQPLSAEEQQHISDILAEAAGNYYEKDLAFDREGNVGPQVLRDMYKEIEEYVNQEAKELSASHD